MATTLDDQTSNHIASISELLSLSGSQYRVYDIGRRIDKIAKEQFEKIESAQLPYPFPLQGYAKLAIAFWQKQSHQPYLWFVKLPLDERGLLNQGARNHFIAIIIEALGSDLSVNPTEQQEALLKKNPYHFTPAQYKLAAINSIISITLQQPASQFYQPALTYLSGVNGWDKWHDIGVQGLCDVAVRLTDGKNIVKHDNKHTNNADVITNAFAHLPEQVLIPLCAALENITLPATLIEAIIKRYQLALDENNSTLALALLRALASSTLHPYSEKFIKELLIDTQVLKDDTLIVIAGRLWSIFTDEDILFTYLEQLTQSNESALFSAVFKDLVAIPAIRPLVLQAIRSPKRSDALAHAIGTLFKQ